MATVITGIVCNDTCFGFGPQDVSPDFLFGPAFGNLGGQPFQLVPDTTQVLTINGVSITDFTLASDGPGRFTATELLPGNIYGISKEFQELCASIPGVPEPATWALLLFGFIILALWSTKRVNKLQSNT